MHVKELQTSKCLIIKYQNEHIANDVLSLLSQDYNSHVLDFKFLPQEQVQGNNQQFLLMKLQKLVQNKNYLHNRKSINLQKMAIEWVNNNIDELFRHKKMNAPINKIVQSK